MFDAGINPLAANSYSQQTNETGGQRQDTDDNPMDLGTDAFLKLLVTQMQHQDPFSEQQDMGDFMSQVSQLTMLERMIEMQNAVEDFTEQQSASSALNLLNKEVEIKTGEESSITGEVTGVRFQHNNAYLKVEGEEYPLEDVIAVADSVGAEPIEEDIEEESLEQNNQVEQGQFEEPVVEEQGDTAYQEGESDYFA